MPDSERDGAKPGRAEGLGAREIVLRRGWQQALLVAGVLLAVLIDLTLPFWRS